MDGTRFDNLARLVGKGASRRTILKGLLGLGGASVAGTVITNEAAARPTGTRPNIPPPPPPTTTTPAPTTTTTTAAPCPGVQCGLDCCDAELQCCDGECCPDGTVCLARAFAGEGPFIQEEVCCPFALTCRDAETGEGLCCDGECFEPGLIINDSVLPLQVDQFDLTCCPAGGTVCEGLNGAFCCQGDTPQCCQVGPFASCIAADACCTDADCPGPCDVCYAGQCVDNDDLCTGCAVCYAGQCVSECLSTEECCVREGQDPVCIDPATQCCTIDDCVALNPGTDRRCWFCRPGLNNTCDPVDDGQACRGAGPAGVCCAEVCIVGATSCPTTTTTTTAQPTTTTTTAGPTTPPPVTTTTAPTTTTTREPCRGLDQACTQPAQCCSGICLDNLCAQCVPNGRTCSFNNQCCDFATPANALCVGSVCVPQVTTTQPPATTTAAPTTTTVACFPNGPLDSGPACTASSQCCEGCCIDADATYANADPICEATDLGEVLEELCKQLIAETQISDVCASNEFIVSNLFPDRPAILPCLP